MSRQKGSIRRSPSRAARWLLAGAGAGATLGLCSSASAQAWLEDRRYSEGAGIRTGDLELHPGVGAEFGYDSNWFRRADSENPIGALRLRITPHFALSSLGPQRREDAPPPDAEFRGEVALSYHEFFPLTDDEGQADQMRDQRNVSGTLRLLLKLASGRPVSGALEAGITRTIQPNNVGDINIAFNRLQPTGGANINFAPGGGLFDFGFGYRLRATIFEQARFSNLNNLQHEIAAKGRWKFLPRSAVFYDTRFSFIDFPDGTQKTSSHPIRAKVGFTGLVTNWLSLLVAGGWGASFYEPVGQEDFDSFIGQVEAKFHLTPASELEPEGSGPLSSTLAIGVMRDFQDAFIGTYFEHNRAYAKLSGFFAGRVLLAAEVGGGTVAWPDNPFFSQPAWTDIKVDGQVFGEYRFTDYFGLNATLRYDHYFSDTTLGGGSGFDALQWQQFTSFLGARLFL